MESKTQKERLEQELRFLKESFEADVISKEEFKKGSDRIEKKLNEVEGEKIKLNVIHDQDEDHEHAGQPQETKQEEQKQETVQQEPETDFSERKGKKRFIKYAVIFVILALVIFFSYSILKDNKEDQQITGEAKFVAACISNDNCKQEGKEGFCLEPGTEEAKCEFRDTPKTNVIVLNNRENCFNCDTERVLGILEGWFGAINTREVDYNTKQGRELAEKTSATLLPAYILDESVSEKTSFDQFKQVFVKKNNAYILSDNAAASTFYFQRENIPNKLDLFVIDGDSASIKAENNLKEFLDVFKNINFDKHPSGDKLAQELGIKIFPSFLVNNRIKFTGIHTADSIKNNFCELNEHDACENSLSKSLV